MHIKQNRLTANDGTKFWQDQEFFRAGDIIICKNSYAPEDISESVELYNEWSGRIKNEILRKSKKLGLKRLADLTDSMLNEIVSKIVLELMRFRNGKRVRQGSAMNFGNDNGVFGVVRRYTEAITDIDEKRAEEIASYVIGKSVEEYQRLKKSKDAIDDLF